MILVSEGTEGYFSCQHVSVVACKRLRSTDQRLRMTDVGCQREKSLLQGMSTSHVLQVMQDIRGGLHTELEPEVWFK